MSGKYRAANTSIALCWAVALWAQSPEERKAKYAAETMYAVATAVGGPNRLIVDKPYAGEATTETVQVLADGNRIVRHNTTKYYRDRRGRTRREQAIETLGQSALWKPAHVVVISDPVTQTDYILDPDRQTVKIFGRLETETPRTSGPKEHLGKRIIEGLTCNGTRIKAVIAPGQQGNERPIVAITETWYSPVIEAVVLSTTSDPRFGTSTYTLHNMSLADQPLSLFEPPTNYRVEFEGNRGVMKRLINP